MPPSTAGGDARRYEIWYGWLVRVLVWFGGKVIDSTAFRVEWIFDIAPMVVPWGLGTTMGFDTQSRWDWWDVEEIRGSR